MDRIKLSLLGLSLTFASVGCTEDIASVNLKTSGMHADFQALASKSSADGVVTGSGTQVSAYLRAGGNKSNTVVDLTDGDELIISTPDEERTLTDEERTTDFDGDEDGLEFTFALMRGGDDDDAPNSTVTLPPNFEIEGLEPEDEQINAERSRSEALELTLAGLDSGEVDWEIEGDCIFRETGSAKVSKSGGIVIPADAVDAHSGDEDSECGAKLKVEIVNKGTLDPALGSGDIRSIRRRWFTFVSTP